MSRLGRTIIRVWMFALFGLACAVAAEETPPPSQSADTSSPRGTLMLFINSANELHDVVVSKEPVIRVHPEDAPVALEAISCLDVSELPEYARDDYATEAAVCIKEVLDRISLPPMEEVPGPEDVLGRAAGKPLTHWRIPGTRMSIVRIDEGLRRGEYLFSGETVLGAPETYERMKQHPYRTEGPPVTEGLHDLWESAPGNMTVARFLNWLPRWLKNRAAGLALWQWAGLILAVFLSLGLMFLAYRIGHARSEHFRKKSLFRYVGTLIFPIVALLVPLGFKYALWEYLSIRGKPLYVSNFAANVVFLAALIVLILGVTNRVAEAVVAMPRLKSRKLDAQFIRIVCRTLGIVAAVVVFLEGGKNLGFPITTLLAGAGIGGLAVALAAQSLLKGLFGTVAILFDKPYQAGDRIIVKNYDGFVEEIGMRTTRIRLLTGHLVSVPNDQIADAEIENVSRRRHIRRLADIRIPLDTPRAKVQEAVELIRSKLENHEGMDPELPPRVFFFDFLPDGFVIRLLYWYTPPAYWEYLAFSERLNFEIFRAFEEQGIPFSLPTRVSYWAKDDLQEPFAVQMVEERAKDLVSSGLAD